MLVDLVMPEMNGIEVCRRINAMRSAADNPVAVLMLIAMLPMLFIYWFLARRFQRLGDA